MQVCPVRLSGDVVTASPEVERKLAEFQERQKSQSERGQGQLPA